jgi:hypothetical protein
MVRGLKKAIKTTSLKKLHLASRPALKVFGSHFTDKPANSAKFIAVFDLRVGQKLLTAFWTQEMLIGTIHFKRPSQRSLKDYNSFRQNLTSIEKKKLLSIYIVQMLCQV